MVYGLIVGQLMSRSPNKHHWEGLVNVYIIINICMKFKVDTTYGFLDIEANFKILTDRQTDVRTDGGMNRYSETDRHDQYIRSLAVEKKKKYTRWS